MKFSVGDIIESTARSGRPYTILKVVRVKENIGAVCPYLYDLINDVGTVWFNNDANTIDKYYVKVNRNSAETKPAHDYRICKHCQIKGEFRETLEGFGYFCKQHGELKEPKITEEKQREYKLPAYPSNSFEECIRQLQAYAKESGKIYSDLVSSDWPNSAATDHAKDAFKYMIGGGGSGGTDKT